MERYGYCNIHWWIGSEIGEEGCEGLNICAKTFENTGLACFDSYKGRKSHWAAARLAPREDCNTQDGCGTPKLGRHLFARESRDLPGVLPTPWLSKHKGQAPAGAQDRSPVRQRWEPGTKWESPGTGRKRPEGSPASKPRPLSPRSGAELTFAVVPALTRWATVFRPDGLPRPVSNFDVAHPHKTRIGRMGVYSTMLGSPNAYIILAIRGC